MDATRTRPGIPAAPNAAANPTTRSAVHALTEHAAGLATPPRGITSVTGGEPQSTVRGGTTPVQVLPNGTTQEPPAATAGPGEAPSGSVTELLTQIHDFAAAAQTAANEATALRAAADRASSAATAFLKSAQDWVNKAMGQAALGHGAEADADMAKAHEAWASAMAQQAIAEQSASGAQAASARAQAACDGAQGALDALRSQGLPRDALMAPLALVDQARRLLAGAERAAAGADLALAAVRRTLASTTDPLEISDVVKLVASAQAQITSAQKEAKAATSASATATSAMKNAKGKLPAVGRELASGGTAAADPVVAQISKSRDSAATGAAQARQHASEARRLITGGATQATAALDAAKALAARFAALGKTSPFVASVLKAAQQAVTASATAQRSTAAAEKAATAAEDASESTKAMLDDANGQVQKYLDDLEAANQNQYNSGGY